MGICLYTFHGDVETTSYFMTRLEKQWRRSGECSIKPETNVTVVPICYDVENKKVDMPAEIVREHERLVAETDTQFYFVTFNFAGIYGDDLWLVDESQMVNESQASDESQMMNESQTADRSRVETKKRLMVDYWNMKVVNILVDHPYHYHAFMEDQIQNRPDRYIQICIDMDHIAYMEKYFPMINMGPFMPSGGTEISTYDERTDMQAGGKTAFETELEEWENRPYDIVFAATYVCPEFFDVFINRNGPEYSAFYHSVLGEVLADHGKRLEDVMRRRLIEEVEEEVSEDELREALGHMQFLDYYIRYKNRERIVKMLAKANFKIHIFGSGWQDMEWDDVIDDLDEEGMDETEKEAVLKRIKSNIILYPYVTSEACLTIFKQAKFVLNVLPSFHNGAHDRIFNAMLNGAICITDTNAYMDTILVDGENALIYNWKQPEAIIDKLKIYLSNDKEKDCKRILDNAYQMAKNHTWTKRAEIVETIWM